MDEARWYFTHESEEDRLWYQTFLSMCRKFGVSWPKATPAQKAFIRRLPASTTSGKWRSGNFGRSQSGAFSTMRFPPDLHSDPHAKKVDGINGAESAKVLILSGQKT